MGRPRKNAVKVDEPPKVETNTEAVGETQEGASPNIQAALAVARLFASRS